MSSLDLDFDLSLEDKKTVNMNIILISQDGYLNMPLAPEILEKMLKHSTFIQNLASGRWDVKETIKLELAFSALSIINFITFIAGDMQHTPSKEALGGVEELVKYFGIDTGMVSTDNLFVLNAENTRIREEELKMRTTQAFDDSKNILDIECKVSRKDTCEHKNMDSIRRINYCLSEYRLHDMTVIAKPISRKLPVEETLNRTAEDIEEYCDVYNDFRTFKQLHPDNSLIIAGGTALRMYTKSASSSDIDLFITTTDSKKAESDVLEFLEFISPKEIFRSKNTLSFFGDKVYGDYQIILRLYSSITQVISGFDVDCACIAFDGRDFYGTPRFRRALTYGYNIADPERQSTTYAHRLFKYCNRGFGIACPGLDMARVDIDKIKSDKKVAGLARVLSVVINCDKANPNDYESLKLWITRPLASFMDIVFSNTIDKLDEQSIPQAENPRFLSEIENCGIKLPRYRFRSRDLVYYPKIRKQFSVHDCYYMLKETCKIKNIEVPFQVFITKKYSSIFSADSEFVFQGEDLKGYVKDHMLRTSLGAFEWMMVDPQRQYTDSFHPTQEDWYYDLYKK